MHEFVHSLTLPLMSQSLPAAPQSEKHCAEVPVTQLPAGVDGSSVANSQTHLCCYKSKAAKLPAPVRAEVTDQLGPRQVEVKQSSLVCEPCSKSLLP